MCLSVCRDAGVLEVWDGSLPAKHVYGAHGGWRKGACLKMALRETRAKGRKGAKGVFNVVHGCV